MRRFKEIFEQHAEVGRFKSVQPRVVKPVGPRPEVDSSNVKMKEETELEKNSAAALTYKDKPNKEPLMKYKERLKEDLRKWFDPKHPEGGWKRINSKGEAVGPCAREPGEAKPKCMSNEKRASLTKKERAAAVNTKRRHDPDPERKGKPINVSNFGKGKLSEQMDNLEEENKPTNPELWSRAKALARSKFDVYPSAYANGWAAKWYKSKGGGWRSVNEETDKNQLDELDTRTLVNYLPKAGASLDSLSPEKRARRHKNMISTWKKVFKRPDGKEEVARYRAKKELSKSVSEETLVEMPGAKSVIKLKNGLPKPISEETDTSEKVEMVESQLHFIKYACEEILEYIKMGGEVEEWYQVKVAKAFSEFESLHAYIEGESRRTGMKEGAEQIDEMHKGYSPGWMLKKDKDLADKVKQAKERSMSGLMKKYGGKTGEEIAKMKKEELEPPFDVDKKKPKKKIVPGKNDSGYSTARHLARMALKKQVEKMKPIKESLLDESRKAEIVKNIMKNKKEKKDSTDKFQSEPVLTSQIVKEDK